MATGRDLIGAAITFLGQPYSTAPGRDDPESGHKDCSGLVAAAYALTTAVPLGANVSVTIFALAQREGLVISREQAYATPGACVFKPDNPLLGWGPAGHIAFSDGEGGTVEATPPRVQRLPLGYNAPWSPEACLLPGIMYSEAAEPVTPPQEESMVIIVGRTVFGVLQAAVYGNGVIGPVFGAESTNAYGVPDDALEWNTQPGRGLRFVYLDPERLGAALLG